MPDSDEIFEQIVNKGPLGPLSGTQDGCIKGQDGPRQPENPVDDEDSVMMRDLLDMRWRMLHYFKPCDNVSKMLKLIDFQIDLILSKAGLEKGLE